MAQLKSTSVIGNLSVTDKIIASEIVANNIVKLGAGTITLEGQTGYITGTWLRTTAKNALNSAASAICVQADGWIYTRTPAQILSDMGVTATVTELNYTDGVTSPIQTQLNNKLSLSGGTLTGNLTMTQNSAALITRAGDGWWTGIKSRTTGDEAVCFDAVNPRTSWMFRTQSPCSDSSAWDDVVPSLHIKRQRVAINKLIANSADAAHYLDVNGDVGATAYVLSEKATIQYNTADDCIEYVFA